MKVYVIIEDQLDENAHIVSTEVVGVRFEREDAEQYIADLQHADARLVAKHLTDPCRYRYKECEVI